MKNAIQTLCSAVSDPEYFVTENNGKILYRHKTEKWEKIIEKEKAKKTYFSIITDETNICLLEKIVDEWTDLGTWF